MQKTVLYCEHAITPQHLTQSKQELLQVRGVAAVLSQKQTWNGHSRSRDNLLLRVCNSIYVHVDNKYTQHPVRSVLISGS